MSEAQAGTSRIGRTLAVLCLVLLLVPALAIFSTMLVLTFSSAFFDDVLRFDLGLVFYLWTLPIVLPVTVFAGVQAWRGAFSMRQTNMALWLAYPVSIPAYKVLNAGASWLEVAYGAGILALTLMVWLLVCIIVVRKLPALEPYLRGRSAI